MLSRRPTDGPQSPAADAGREIRRLLSLYRAGDIGEDELVADLSILSRPPAVTDGAAPPARATERERLAKRERIALLLDGYRAAEASGAEAVTMWAEVTSDERLAGGLRVIAAREAGHADLLARRVRELGREPSAEVPEWLERYNAALLDDEATDEERLAAVVSRFPDVDEAMAPLRAAIERMDDDPLTSELLRAVAQDEEATLRWLHEAWTLCTRRR